MLSKDFVLAGRAIFTVEIPAGDVTADRLPHYTFRVDRIERSERWPEAYFVKYLSGPDNEADYTYLGKLDPKTGFVQLTARSGLPPTSYRYRLLNRVIARIWADDLAAVEAAGYKVHHEGKCGRCGRTLTVPASVESGIGPECAKILASA